MNKYIDKEKLVNEINSRLAFYLGTAYSVKDTNIVDGLNEALEIIDSLQQEQSNVVTKLRHHLATTPREQLEKEWKELEHFCDVGPTVQEFLSENKSKVDFEEEWEKFEDWVESYNQSDYPTCYEPKQIARHFYQIGLNVRKED